MDTPSKRIAVFILYYKVLNFRIGPNIFGGVRRSEPYYMCVKTTLIEENEERRESLDKRRTK